MNYVFISPAYPVTCTLFCERLHEMGVNVLGIGDVPYDDLNERLKGALMEYYYVDSLEDYDRVYRAVAFYIHKYGRIDWLESLNEYWLPADARLRTDFNIAVGTREHDIWTLVKKSGMKKVFLDAGIPTARQHIVTDLKAGKAFVEEVGYPVIVKPDIGVGATNTWKLENDGDLNAFYDQLPKVPYVMEEFIQGDICSYDAIVDSRCEPLFESMTVWPPVMDIVNRDLDLMYYTCPEVPQGLRELGRRTVRAFQVDRRFVHLEFFRLTQARKGLGKVRDFVALEVNMRPAGGYTPDMIDFAHSTDVYQIWADMVTDNVRKIPDSGEHCYCVYASRRDCHRYAHSHEEILERYGEDIVMCERMPEMMVPQMGNQMYTAKRPDYEAAMEFIRFVQEQV